MHIILSLSLCESVRETGAHVWLIHNVLGNILDLFSASASASGSAGAARSTGLGSQGQDGGGVIDLKCGAAVAAEPWQCEVESGMGVGAVCQGRGSCPILP